MIGRRRPGPRRSSLAALAAGLTLVAADAGSISWSWNPNSSDAGSLLADDWLTIVEPERHLLALLLDVTPSTAWATPRCP